MIHFWSEKEKTKAKRHVVRADNVREIMSEALTAIAEEFARLSAVPWPEGSLHPSPPRNDLRIHTWGRENNEAIAEAFRIERAFPGVDELKYLDEIAEGKGRAARR